MCAAEKKNRGCFFYGCLTAVILALILFIGVPIALYFGVQYAANKFVENYTDTEPMELPVVELAEADLTLLQQRVESFRAALDDDPDGVPRLELTATELNALIFHDRQLQKLKGKAFIHFEDDKIKGQVSIPLSDLDLDTDEERYINGTGVFELAIQNGTLSLMVDSLTIKDKPLPGQISSMIQGKNMLQDAQLDPEARKLVDRIQTLEVKDGKLLLELTGSPTIPETSEALLVPESSQP